MNKEKSYDILSNPTEALQAALDRLNLFTQIKEVRLNINETGQLIVTEETVLNRTVGLARHYLGQFFSEAARREHEKKLKLLKQAILHDRDIIQSHTALIEKLKAGNQKLGFYALEVIQKYNEVVTKKIEHSNYDYQFLLEDKEIHENRIELPLINSVKIDSHPHDYPARKILEDLSETLRFGASSFNCANVQLTPKDSNQLMLDTFRMKAIRLIQENLPDQMTDAEVRQLVHHTPIYSDQDSIEGVIHTHQKIEMGPGSFIILTGLFKKQSVDSKFVMPTFEVRLSAQHTHSGFPYPAQHTGWSLVNSAVEANPLRIDPLPLFQSIDQRKKQVVHKLLFDSKTIARARHQVKMIREATHCQIDNFLKFHQQLQNKFLLLNPQNKQWSLFLTVFYDKVKQLSSPFNYLTELQQQFNHFFVQNPLKALEEKWLEAHSPLRIGSPEEKFKLVTQFLDQKVLKIRQQFDQESQDHQYLFFQEALLGPSLRDIGLVYCSEKMGFIPPHLTFFQQQLQFSAFRQLLQFLNHIENGPSFFENLQEMSHALQNQWATDLQVFDIENLKDFDQVLGNLIDELNNYFYSKTI